MKKILPKATIVSAKRLPIGKVNGIYATKKPEELFSQLFQNQARLIPGFSMENIDQIILGNVTNLGGNLARRCAIASEIPLSKSAYTIDCQCASGLMAVISGVQSILSGDAQIVLAGGVESTSTANIVLDRQTNKIIKRFPMVPQGQMDLDMGIIAENMSEKYHISRVKQDEYAFKSQFKAKKADEQETINQEIVPFGFGKKLITKDQCPRFKTSIDQLAELKAAFRQNGTVTAGNSCPINDGAATVILKKYNKVDVAQGYYLDQATVGVLPEEFILGPVYATKKLLNRHHLTISDIDVVELNEAFAVQGILCCEQLGISEKQLNPLGGALAYGHPYGATGAILVSRLLNSLNRIERPALGLVTLCVAGGMGMSVLIGNKYWQ
ncbi:thiolase family protein [Leuconostoc suionicum]|uniref:thiolase family protein n=1 Tax=Leuconostoc suionicum TaxID=1511761 RepID=UPI00233F311C|nr:thiolase family protein [Leuconostoc suionicum]MDC2815627.1 thiolase family protein [Leuconostoc suionicum]